MKKIYNSWILWILIFCFFRSDTSYANEISSVHSKEVIKDEKEQKEIHDLLSKMYSEKEKEKTVLEENDYIITKYQEEKAYKIYDLPFLMLTEYQKEKTFEKIITENYCWKVPFQTATGEFGVEEFINKNEKIEWKAEITGNMTGEIFPENEILMENLQEQMAKDEIVENMIYTFSTLYYSTSFVYFRTNKMEYIIPYSPREEWLGLTNGEVYTVEKAMKILNKKFDESHLKLGEYKDTMGEIVPPKRQPQINKYAIIGIFCAFIGIFSVVVLKIKKKKIAIL